MRVQQEFIKITKAVNSREPLRWMTVIQLEYHLTRLWRVANPHLGKVVEYIWLTAKAIALSEKACSGISHTPD